MSSKFKHKWQPTLFKLMLMIGVLLEAQELHCQTFANSITSTKNVEEILSKKTELSNNSLSMGQEISEVDEDLCYLLNNKASESLTISESTPVGTVVGELQVSNLGLLQSMSVM